MTPHIERFCLRSYHRGRCPARLVGQLALTSLDVFPTYLLYRVGHAIRDIRSLTIDTAKRLCSASAAYLLHAADQTQMLWNQLVRWGRLLGLSSQLDEPSSWPVIFIGEEIADCLLGHAQKFGRPGLVSVAY